jgi:hypothetical protein
MRTGSSTEVPTGNQAALSEFAISSLRTPWLVGTSAKVLATLRNEVGLHSRPAG